MEQILILEDDTALNQGLCKALKTDSRKLVSCETIKAARDQLLCSCPSLILLDINLPDGSGLDFLQELKRNDPKIPVILLTANDTDMDIVKGLELGADDYITKPFSLSVLRARVNTQLRKAESLQAHTSASVYKKGCYEFDFERMIFFVDGQEIELSKTEQRLLRLLVQNEGINLRRDFLLDRVWNDSAEFVDANALSVSVKRLRDKLGTPTWWYTMAPAVLTFLTTNDFTGKTVIPFMTNGGWPGHVIKDMKANCKGADFAHEMQIRFDSMGKDHLETPEREIEEWVEKVKQELC